MKKRTKIIFIVITLILLTGIIVTSVNYFIADNMKISSRVMKKLSKSNKIVIKDRNHVMGTITEESVIEEILSILSEATGNLNKPSTCEGNTIYFEMYTEDKLIDKIDVFLNRGIKPRSIKRGGCSKYYFSPQNRNDLTILIEEQTGTKFFRLFGIYDYLEDCVDDLDLIYEDSYYRYYFSCIKSDKVFIEFTTTNLKMTLKEALKDNHISISELTRIYPNLFYKEMKLFNESN